MIKSSIKLIGLAIAAPFVAAAGFVYYVGFKTTSWAFRHPGYAVATLAAGGALWYAVYSVDLRSTVIAGAGNVASVLEGNRSLEQKIAQLERQNTDQAQAMEQQKIYLGQLEKTLAANATPSSSVAQAPPPPTPQQALKVQPPTTPITNQTARALRDSQYNFYYVHPGETLGLIAGKITNNPNNYRLLQQDNNITDSSLVLAGQLLKVRKELCKNVPDGLYEEIPNLHSIILPATVRISDHFGAQASEVLEINRRLGLYYNDEFPIRNGARVVYYK